MTSTVTVAAHCGDDKHVEVTVFGDGHPKFSSVKNGESQEYTIFDDISVSAKESSTPPPAPPTDETIGGSEACDPAEE